MEGWFTSNHEAFNSSVLGAIISVFSCIQSTKKQTELVFRNEKLCFRKIITPFMGKSVLIGQLTEVKPVIMSAMKCVYNLYHEKFKM